MQMVILDAGPIRELVAYHAVHEFKFEGLRDELKFIQSAASYENCVKFLARFSKKMTSPSVVAELHRWIRETDSNGRTRLWERVYEEFEKMDIDEEIVKLLDMDISLVAKHGPCDVSLLEIARRSVRQTPVIFTIDSRLQGECRKAQISSRSLLEACI